MINWEAGQRIVCIKPVENVLGAILPVVGDVYTIRSINACLGGIIGVRLEEIPDQKVSTPLGVFDLAFEASHFRPVKPTSIECFRHHLAPSPVGQLEGV